MSIDAAKLLILSILWYSKSTSLPKLYYLISNRRGIHINQLRACERHSQKIVKLKLDIKYLESCADLKICPKFLKCKPPNISVYQNADPLCAIGLQRKIKDTKRTLRIAVQKYNQLKSLIFNNTSLLEKHCLKYLLQKYFQNLVKKTQILRHRKLYNLRRQQRACSPNSTVNLSNKQLFFQEKEVVRFRLNHRILPRKIK